MRLDSTRCTTTKGYITVRIKGHPRADRWDNVYEHFVIAEEILGKDLPKNAVIHHIDGDGMNNSLNNLIICENQSYHMLLELRTKALKACGNAKWRQCKYCKEWDSPENMKAYSNKAAQLTHYYHKSCPWRKSRTLYEKEKKHGQT